VKTGSKGIAATLSSIAVGNVGRSLSKRIPVIGVGGTKLEKKKFEEGDAQVPAGSLNSENFNLQVKMKSPRKGRLARKKWES